MFFFTNHVENEVRRLGSDFLLFFNKDLYKAKAKYEHIIFNIFFSRPCPGHAVKANFITVQIVASEIFSILSFYERVWD